MFGREYKFKPPHWHRLKKPAGLSGLVGRVIIQYHADGILSGVFFIQYLQEFNKIRTFIGTANQRYSLFDKQVYPCTEQNSPQPFKFIITGNFSVPFFRAQVIRSAATAWIPGFSS